MSDHDTLELVQRLLDDLAMARVLLAKTLRVLPDGDLAAAVYLFLTDESIGQ